MEDPKSNNQNQKDKKKDPQSMVFICGDKDSVVATAERGKFNLRFMLKQSHKDSKSPIHTRVYVQDQFLTSVDVEKEFEIKIDGVKLDVSKPVKIKIQKPSQSADQAMDIFDLPVDLKKLKLAKPERKQLMKIVVEHLTATQVNPVQVFLYAEDGSPKAGEIEIQLGQAGSINGHAVTAIESRKIPVDETGKVLLQIIVNEKNDFAYITNVDTKHVEKTYFRKYA